MLSIALPLEGILVAVVDGLEREVMLDGVAGGPALPVSVVDGDVVPMNGGGGGGVGIVLNWPKLDVAVAVAVVEPSGPAVAEAETDNCAGRPAKVRPGVKG